MPSIIPTQSLQLPFFTSTFDPPPYSSASHSTYRASKLLSGLSSKDWISLGERHTVPGVDGNIDASRDRWKHVLARKVCSKARVVKIWRSRRSSNRACISWGLVGDGDGSRFFSFMSVIFPPDHGVTLALLCDLGVPVGADFVVPTGVLGPASGRPSFSTPKFLAYEMSSSPSNLMLPQFVMVPFRLEYKPLVLPFHEPNQSPAQIMHISS